MRESSDGWDGEEVGMRFYPLKLAQSNWMSLITGGRVIAQNGFKLFITVQNEKTLDFTTALSLIKAVIFDLSDAGK